MNIKPTEEAIDAVLNECAERINSGESKFSGMSYEDGVKAAIEWVLGYGDSASPMAD